MLLPGTCLESTIYPFKASVYYSILEQNDFGAEERTWVYDRQVSFMAQSVGDNSYRQDLDPGIYIKYDEGLMGRVVEDIRISSNGVYYPMTEIILTNIIDEYGDCQYKEYGGPRESMPTVFNLKTIAPSFDPFGKRDYFKVVLTRAQDQTAEGAYVD